MDFLSLKHLGFSPPNGTRWQNVFFEGNQESKVSESTQAKANREVETFVNWGIFFRICTRFLFRSFSLLCFTAFTPFTFSFHMGMCLLFARVQVVENLMSGCSKIVLLLISDFDSIAAFIILYYKVQKSSFE